MMLNKLRMAVGMLLAIGALGIGASMLPHPTVAAEPLSPVSGPAVPWQDMGNIKETVLALEKRIWEAHTKQDLNTFKNLLADDFTATGADGRSETKKDVLAWVTSFRVLDPVMKNARVVVLNATSAIVTYEIRYRVGSPTGQELQVALPSQATSGWALRDGQWWCVYSDSSYLREKDGARWKATMADRVPPGVAVDSDRGQMRVKVPVILWDKDGHSEKVREPLSVQLEKINREK
jgi:hypothetical protein